MKKKSVTIAKGTTEPVSPLLSTFRKAVAAIPGSR